MRTVTSAVGVELELGGRERTPVVRSGVTVGQQVGAEELGACRTVLSNGLNQIGAADYTQTIIKGLVIIVAAVFTMASQRKLIVILTPK
jgi:predicted ABC-type sugar transport system permease subunit